MIYLIRLRLGDTFVFEGNGGKTFLLKPKCGRRLKDGTLVTDRKSSRGHR